MHVSMDKDCRHGALATPSFATTTEGVCKCKWTVCRCKWTTSHARIGPWQLRRL